MLRALEVLRGPQAAQGCTSAMPTDVADAFHYGTQPHHPALVVLDVALQAAIRALHQAHPVLDDDDQPPPPYDHSAKPDEVLAQILVVSSYALLDLLRHYRAVQDELTPI